MSTKLKFALKCTYTPRPHPHPSSASVLALLSTSLSRTLRVRHPNTSIFDLITLGCGYQRWYRVFMSMPGLNAKKQIEPPGLKQALEQVWATCTGNPTAAALPCTCFINKHSLFCFR